MSLFMNGYSYADDPLYLFCVSIIEADNSNQKKIFKTGDILGVHHVKVAKGKVTIHEELLADSSKPRKLGKKEIQGTNQDFSFKIEKKKNKYETIDDFKFKIANNPVYYFMEGSSYIKHKKKIVNYEFKSTCQLPSRKLYKKFITVGWMRDGKKWWVTDKRYKNKWILKNE